jgi:hypothetical protein
MLLCKIRQGMFTVLLTELAANSTLQTDWRLQTLDMHYAAQNQIIICVARL